jgi:AraC-like DNA-binding protein
VGDWRKATAADLAVPTASTAGVLRPDELARHVELRRDPAGPRVDPWVENHWSLRWDLPDGRWFPSQILPHPTCALTVELGCHPRPEVPPGETVVVTGVMTRRFDVDITGWGRVVGVRFRPGGLAALTGRSASGWTDRVVPAHDVLPPGLCSALADPDLAASPDAWADAAEAGLAGMATAGDPRYDQLLEVVADMLADRSLLTVTEVAHRHGWTPRSLQRLFTHYVGVGPKWVLARYRMHDVVAEIDAGYTGTLTDLAHRYGWYDQAHFTRDFTALVGVTPSRYRDRGDRDG